MHIELKWKLPYILYRYTFTVRHPKPYSKYSGLCPAEQDRSATVECPGAGTHPSLDEGVSTAQRTSCSRCFDAGHSSGDL